MGGMGRYLPYTTGLMWIGALSLAGMPPFSGFFSKDQILADALARGDWVGYTVWGLGLAGAFVTALYTFRLMLLVFHGQPSDYARRHGEAHAGHGEGPFSMLWTIGVLGRRRALRRACSRSRGVTHGDAQLPRADGARRASRRRATRSSAPPRSRSRSRSSGCSPRTCCGAAAATRRGASPRRRRRSRACCRTSSASTGSTTGRSTGPPSRSPAAGSGSGRTTRSVGSMNVVGAAGQLDEPAALDRAVRARPRLRAGDRGRHRGARRVADHGRLVSGTWTSTLLWLLPLGGALAVLDPAAARRRARRARAARHARRRRSSRSPRPSSSTPRAARSSSSRTPGCATSG